MDQARPNWTNIRIRASTRQKLDSVLQSMMVAVEQGQRDCELDHRNDKPSLDWVIRELVRFREQHAKRRKLSRDGRKETKEEVCVGDGCHE